MRWLRTHSVRYGSCKSSEQGMRVPFRPRTLANYQRTLERALGACAVRLPVAFCVEGHKVLATLPAVKRIGGVTDDVAAWWDADFGYLYVRLPRALDGSTHYAVVTADSDDLGAGAVMGGLDQCCRVRLTSTPWALSSAADVNDLSLNSRRSCALRAALVLALGSE